MKIKLLAHIIFMVICVSLQAEGFKSADPKDMALLPQRNAQRDIRNISGIWRFKIDPDNKGEKAEWYNGLKDFNFISVPGSWNEQFPGLMEYRDWVWYQTETFVPTSWKDDRVYIRVGEASYAAKVWVNGQAVGKHEGAFVPFAFDITSVVDWGKKNIITIQVENQKRHLGGQAMRLANSEYDGFSYGGLNREVMLYTVPSKNYLKDITIHPEKKGKDGLMNIQVELGEENDNFGGIIISDQNKQIEKKINIVEGKGKTTVKIPNARFWSPVDPHLYEITVFLGKKHDPEDTYNLKTGLRTVSVENEKILLNGEPICLRGVGTRQDFPIYGRGSNYPVMVKDFNLMKWLGANSYRTSSQMHDEAYYSKADQEGLLVIGETPAVGLFTYNDTTSLEKIEGISKQYLQEMILRDKNHPSIIIWGLANEPIERLGRKDRDERSQEKAYKLFSEYIGMAKELDPTRLVMYMGESGGPSEWFNLVDLICINRFGGWGADNGRIELGVDRVGQELDRLYKQYGKPCMLTQFGASVIPGAHSIQPEMFTEEYQKRLIEEYLNMANSKDFIAGMFISNLSDYKTPQSIDKMGGVNRKGLFTRDRRPKAAAFYLHDRWKQPKLDF